MPNYPIVHDTEDGSKDRVCTIDTWEYGCDFQPRGFARTQDVKGPEDFGDYVPDKPPDTQAMMTDGIPTYDYNEMEYPNVGMVGCKVS